MVGTGRQVAEPAHLLGVAVRHAAQQRLPQQQGWRVLALAICRNLGEAGAQTGNVPVGSQTGCRQDCKGQSLSATLIWLPSQRGRPRLGQLAVCLALITRQAPHWAPPPTWPRARGPNEAPPCWPPGGHLTVRALALLSQPLGTHPGWPGWSMAAAWCPRLLGPQGHREEPPPPRPHDGTALAHLLDHTLLGTLGPAQPHPQAGAPIRGGEFAPSGTALSPPPHSNRKSAKHVLPAFQNGGLKPGTHSGWRRDSLAFSWPPATRPSTLGGSQDPGAVSPLWGPGSRLRGVGEMALSPKSVPSLLSGTRPAFSYWVWSTSGPHFTSRF